MFLRALLLGLALLAPLGAANTAEPIISDDPATDERLRTLAQELRCLVCQNETLADSNADLAADLRREIRAMMDAGKSDKEIIEFLVARYGDFVLYRPPVKSTTVMLWVGPFLLLAGGLLVAIVLVRRRARVVAAPALTEEQHRQAQALLQETRKDKKG